MLVLELFSQQEEFTNIVTPLLFSYQGNCTRNVTHVLFTELEECTKSVTPVLLSLLEECTTRATQVLISANLRSRSAAGPGLRTLSETLFETLLESGTHCVAFAFPSHDHFGT